MVLRFLGASLDNSHYRVTPVDGPLVFDVWLVSPRLFNS